MCIRDRYQGGYQGYPGGQQQQYGGPYGGQGNYAGGGGNNYGGYGQQSGPGGPGAYGGTVNQGGWRPPQNISQQDMKRYGEQAFFYYDKDRSGSLDRSEFYPTLTYLFGLLNYPAPDYNYANAIFDGFDRNKDGRMSYSEFMDIVYKICNIM
eukprot:TRINITY_DN147_c0_g1_i8.p3 TRINITY_DN147_c0_g1~~TRINITY_DN147_c0_g1_i8.p3  ORF type:complete len:152 (-),score=26.38 TRINITY_DN147_c0_g1_i8:90-545(-)